MKLVSRIHSIRCAQSNGDQPNSKLVIVNDTLHYSCLFFQLEHYHCRTNENQEVGESLSRLDVVDAWTNKKMEHRRMDCCGHGNSSSLEVSLAARQLRSSNYGRVRLDDSTVHWHDSMYARVYNSACYCCSPPPLEDDNERIVFSCESNLLVWLSREKENVSVNDLDKHLLDVQVRWFEKDSRHQLKLQEFQSLLKIRDCRQRRDAADALLNQRRRRWENAAECSLKESFETHYVDERGAVMKVVAAKVEVLVVVRWDRKHQRKCQVVQVLHERPCDQLKLRLLLRVGEKYS